MYKQKSIVTYNQRTRKITCKVGENSSFSFYYSSFGRALGESDLKFFKLIVIKEDAGNVIEDMSGKTIVKGELTAFECTVKFELSIPSVQYNKKGTGAAVSDCFFTRINTQRTK